MKIYDEEETVIRRTAAGAADEVTLADEATVAATLAGPGAAPEISLFLPVLNEEPNLRPLHVKIDEALAHLGRTAEIIYVDDGSTDGSLEVLRELIALLERELGRKARIDRQPPQPGDVPQTFADVSKARRLLGYDPGTDIVEGLRRFVEWFREEGVG